MTRQDLNGKNYNEVEPILTQELNEYKEKVNQMMTVDDILKAEEELMADAKAYDEYLTGVTYELPNGVDYDGDHFSRNDCAKIIMGAINKLEVEWAQTLGLYELVKLWKNKDLATIANKAYDSTLRVLNQVKYKGFDEWRNILAVNAFLAQCHNAYSLDTAYNILISEKHNALMDREKLLQKKDNVVDEQSI